MKMVIAIIKPFKLDEVREALAEAWVTKKCLARAIYPYGVPEQRKLPSRPF